MTDSNKTCSPFRRHVRLCVKAVTEPDSAESTEITERPGTSLRKIANKYVLITGKLRYRFDLQGVIIIYYVNVI